MAVPRGDGSVFAIEFAGEDDRFAAAECPAAATGVTVVAPGLATARGLDAGRFRDLAFGRRAGDLVARTGADVPAARAALAAATVDRAGSVAVRARDVRGTAGVSTADAERELGAALVEQGFAVDLDDPDHLLRALFAGETCLLCWQTVESDRGFGDRAPTDRPFFRPGSMAPMLARALVNLALGRRDPGGATLVDPMCGTGGVLVEGGLVGARTVGVDADPAMVAGAAENLAHYLDGSTYAVLRGDATRLPLADGAADAAVFDVPYGRQSSPEAGEAGALVRGALAAARRVAPRAVVVADRSLEPVAGDAGWTLEDRFERRVHRSLVRHVHVLC